MKLYHMPGACSLADLIVLQWIGADHEPVRMSLETIKSPAYLAINAGGTVPLLAHGDLSLTENVAILGYLADLHPKPDCWATARRRPAPKSCAGSAFSIPTSTRLSNPSSRRNAS